MDTTYPSTTDTRRTTVVNQGASQAVYGLGMIGAWVYYIGHAASFGMGLLGFLKGIVWPAFVVFELMKYLNM